MLSVNALQVKQSHTGLEVRVFTRSLLFAWISLATGTIVLEVMPIPLMLPYPFYAYCAAKAMLFVLLGYTAPLTFWAFNVLNRGVCFAAVSASCVETLQGLLGHGHSFHWYELLLKLGLILVGFMLALNARYDRQIALGPLRIHLIEQHR